MMSEKSQVPKGYRRTELGTIPEEWEVKPLGKCAKLQGGFAFKSKDAAESGVRWLKIANVGIGSIKWDVESYLPLSFIEDYPEYLLKKDQIAMAMTRPVLGDKLKITKIKETDVPSLLNQRVGRFATTDNLDNDYLYQVARDTHFLEEIKIKIRGTDPPNISSTHIESIKIAVPSLPEQQKIASVLSKVDEQIEQTEQIIERTEILKKGLMQKLFTKGIGHTKFKKTELGDIPEEWDTAEFYRIMGEAPKAGIYKSKEFYGEGYKIVRMTEFFRCDLLDTNCSELLKLSDQEINAYSLISGDLLFARRSMKVEGAGKCVLAFEVNDQMVFESSIIRIRLDKKRSDPLFYLYYLNSVGRSQISRTIRTVSVSGVTGNDLKKIIVLNPPLEEQQKISSILSKVDSQIQDNQSYLTRIQELKKGLMQDLLTGKVRVCA